MRTNATRDAPFHLVYGADVVLPLEIYLQSARVEQFNKADQGKDKFSSSWEGPFIVVNIVASGAYVLAEVDSKMLPSTWNIDHLHKYYA
jgi:hypothetical protein